MRKDWPIRALGTLALSALTKADSSPLMWLVYLVSTADLPVSCLPVTRGLVAAKPFTVPVYDAVAS